jgi:hypothetical protein
MTSSHRRHPGIGLLAVSMLALACGKASAPRSEAPATPESSVVSTQAVPQRSETRPTQQEQSATAQAYASYNLPEWVGGVWGAKGLADDFEYNLALNPFFQVGHFDGDTLLDIAVSVVNRANGKIGVVLIHRADSLTTIVGAGKAVPAGGDDFAWLGVWKVRARDPARRLPGSGIDWLALESPESAGVSLWWNGQAYETDSFGD